MGGSYTDQWIQQWSESAARWAVETARQAVLAILQLFGSTTEPSFVTIGPAYNRMLAIALLLAGAVISFALVESMLGGARGTHLSVIPRTLAACVAAVLGLGVVEYAAGYANLLASAWNNDFTAASSVLASNVNAIYAYPTTNGQALGSAGGVILVALLTTLLALLIYIELILRAALILVTTTFLPLMCLLAIWPRMVPALKHLVEFLVALLMSKFVMATAVYVGYSLVANGFGGPGPHASANALVTGLATLAVAALSPALLFQGIRLGEVSAANAARGWSWQAVRVGLGAGRFVVATYLSGASLSRLRRALGMTTRRVADSRRRRP